jgi:anti-sigma regulatory factor (Ser/Thr protein kinase)
MEVIEHALLRVTDVSTVGEARRAASDLARKIELGETDAGRAALVVTEAATNVVKHGGGGEIFLRELRREAAAAGIGILALDRGPGIGRPADALRDGYSTRGTSGTGLGAIARTATRFDLYSALGAGTVIAAEVWPANALPPRPSLAVGGVVAPYPGEVVSGDAWAAHESPEAMSVIVADGLGHGERAAEAARVAVAAFGRHAGLAPADLLARVHEALRPTRGAAAAIAHVDRRRGVVRFAGLGNISATIVSGGATRSLVSHHGTAGGVARRIQEFNYPWSAGDLLVLHSDGIATHWKPDAYPGLAQRDPAIVAAVLYRDHTRGRDDATVVAVREAS